MAKLIYPMNVSLDGYMEDGKGNLDWSISDDEIFAFWTDFQRSIGTYLYGRRMYESMRYWEAENPQTPVNYADGKRPEAMQTFAHIWQKAQKIVFSRTLPEVSSPRTRIEREFDLDAIRKLKSTSEAAITISGANLAGQAMSAGLIDEYYILVHPIILGGGKRAFLDSFRMPVELISERRFKSGVIHLHYRMKV